MKMGNKDHQLPFAGLAAIAVGYGFARYGYGLFVPTFREEFDLATGMVGFIASGSYLGYFIALMLVGVLAVRTGPRLLVVIGVLSAAIGMSLMAAASHPFLFALGVFIAGSSTGWSWPPFSDAVARRIPPPKQSRALSIVSSGTAFGLVIIGPIALLSGEEWRTVWLIFAAVAFIVAAWNAWAVPGLSKQKTGHVPSLRWSWFVCPKSRPLFFVAFSYGVTSSVYWTYAVDLTRSGNMPADTGPVFWTLVGIGGFAGLAAGDCSKRFGLKYTLAAILAAYSLSIGTLAITLSWATIIVSGALYGATFMMLAALLVIWSADVFQDRPSVGVSAVILSLTTGSMLGPAVFGPLADTFHLRVIFIIMAGLALLTVFVRPKGLKNS